MAVDGDTIFALATPPGKSAIAVIRISGPQASGAPAVFGADCPDAGRFSVARLCDDAGRMIDQVVILFMAGPRSSTGEDVTEIHCHGSRAVTLKLLDMLAKANGFRPAEPGEFTHRAFHHDKMDLSGAEGLADLIDAETDIQLSQAWNQMDGALRRPVMAWRTALISISGQLEALIDFADESLPPSIEAKLRGETEQLIETLSGHLDDGRYGEIVRGGVSVALVGPVNAGKSTLLNRLAGRDAAIVSHEAGTTRDIVSVRLDIGGIPANIMDTAGIRSGVGSVEEEGIRRAIEAARSAHITVLVMDGSIKDWQEIAQTLSAHIGGESILLVNKADLGIVGAVPDGAIEISLKSGDDSAVDILIERLISLMAPANKAAQTPLITRARHRAAIDVAAAGLRQALSHNFHDRPELAAEDFRQAAVALGRITGEIDVEELLGSIFSSFCIGK